MSVVPADTVCLSVCLPLQSATCYRAQHQLSPTTSQSLDRRRGEQETVTIETSAAGCSLTHSLTYLLLYELKQGASIHILAREVRGAAEDKGIGRNKGGGGVAGGAVQDGGQNVVVGSSWCLNYTVRPLRSFRVPPPLVMTEKSCSSVMAVSQE